jgi:hypothetical protein
MTFEQDFALYRYMVAELNEFLAHEKVFWPLLGMSQQLSVGLLLLVQKRLNARVCPPAAQGELERFNARVETARQQQPAAFAQKAEKEWNSRLNLWRSFWENDTGATASDNYLTAATHRAVLTLLAANFPEIAARVPLDHLDAVDALARPRLKTNAFLWPTDLQAAFPIENFWFLHSKL